MHFRRRLGLALAGTSLLIVLSLVALTFLFRDRLGGLLREKMRESVAADVDWGGLRLSLLRSFPNLSLRLESFTLTGLEGFEGDTLAHVPRFDLTLNAASAVRALRGTGPLEVRSIRIERPDVRLVVREDGAANWEILRGAEEAGGAEASPLSLSLRRFEIVDGSLSLEDREKNFALSMTGLRQSLSGDLRQARFRLDTRTGSESVSLRFAGIPYLSRVAMDVAAALDVDAASGRVSVQDGEVRLNELRLGLSGSARMGTDSLELDLAFQTSGTDFRELLSLVPAVYLQPEFAALQTAGVMSVAGWVRGGYGEHTFPAFALEAEVEDGRFRYPDLALPVRNIAAALSMTNPGGDVDRTVVELRHARLTIGAEPVEAAFTLRTPASDPDLALRARGKLDLADLGRAVPLADVETLAGVLALDADVRSRMSDLEHRRYERVAAEGTLGVTGFRMTGAAVPHPVEIDEARLRLSPRFAELAALRGRIGRSDATITGRIDNLLGFALRGEELRGAATVASRFVDLNEWRSDDEARAVPVPANLDLSLEASIDRMAFQALELRNARGSVRVKDERATLDAFGLELLGGTMSVTGFYDTALPGRPTFDVALRLADLDVGQAFAGVETVRILAPAARFAQGRVSTDLRMHGALGADMTPVFETLSGQGTLRTAGLALQGVPALDRLAETLKLERLREPSLADLRSSFRIEGGRIHVSPFDLRFGEIPMRASGSHGIDQSLDYVLDLQIPRHLLGSGANQVVAELAQRSGAAGLNFQAAETIHLGAELRGTLESPVLATSLRSATTSLAQAAGGALRDEAERRVDEVAQRVDSAAAEARARAEAERRRILEDAERQAERIRRDAQALAEAARAEGDTQANALVAQAGTPVARRAADVAADRLRREADRKAEQILHDADRRADALLEEARRKTEARDTR